MFHCDVCGRRLTLPDLWQRLTGRQMKTYPFRDVEGDRREMPVKSVCRRCVQRAEEHRRTPAP